MVKRLILGESPYGLPSLAQVEAGDLLCLIQYPDLLETQTIEEIHRIFRRNDYKPVDGGSVTIGWGRKVGDPGAATGALIRISPPNDAIAMLTMGSKGSYSLSTVVADAQRPTCAERNDMKNYLSLIPMNIGARLRDWIRQRGLVEELTSELISKAAETRRVIADVTALREPQTRPALEDAVLQNVIRMREEALELTDQKITVPRDICVRLEIISGRIGRTLRVLVADQLLAEEGREKIVGDISREIRGA